MNANIGSEKSFWELYSKHEIRIPQIQRDYIQGRNNFQVKKNRENLVDCIIESLKDETPLLLNFVYGYYEDDKFIPIDGQQRLTTLFLLHFYIGSRAYGTELKGHMELKFSYETRFTNQRFFEELFNESNCIDWNTVDNNEKENALQNYIVHSPWYHKSWNNNPTINSCVVMLNTIHNTIKRKYKNGIDWKKLFESLTGIGCPINFMLLEINAEVLGKPNELYIRMNSRGKQLTGFENFKSSLYGFIREQNINIDEKYSDFKAKIDGEWQDMIWNIYKCNEDWAEKSADMYFLDLFHWIIMNRMLIETEFDLSHLKDYWSPERKNIFYIEKYREIFNLSNNPPKDFNECLKNSIIDFYCTLDIMNNIFKEQQNIKEEDYRYRLLNNIKNDLFFYCDNKGKYKDNLLYGYKNRIKLFTITQFGLNQFGLKYNNNNKFDIDIFLSWYRIINNLTNYSQIDKPESVKKVFYNIRNLECDYFKRPDEIGRQDWTGTGVRSTSEEIYKQKLINDNSDWKRVIYNAEGYEYFAGEIGFAFECLNLNKHNSPQYFEEKWKVIESVFEFAKNDRDEKEGKDKNLFHRSLLTIFDYSTKDKDIPDDYKTFYYYVYNDEHRNKDWRGFLRKSTKPEEKEKYNEIIKGFSKYLDGLSNSNITGYANSLIEKYGKDISNFTQDPIRYFLIKKEELFKFCYNYYIWKQKVGKEDKTETTFLMPSSVRHKCAEFYTYILYSCLGGKEYEYCNSTDWYNDKKLTCSCTLKGNIKIKYSFDSEKQKSKYTIQKNNKEPVIIENIEEYTLKELKG